MFKKSDYEKLIKQGYTEEEIKVALDSLSQLSVSEDALGKGRDDRGIIATDASGKSKKTSSLMMGYNKAKIQLENGEYVSFEDFRYALESSLSDNSEDVVYVCKKTGKKIEYTDMIESIFEQVTKEASNFTLSPSSVITNQEASKIEVNDPNLDKTFSKGVLMLGNDGITLPNGEYVYLTELEQALSDYVKLSPKVEEKKSITEKPEDSIDPEEDLEIYTIIERFQNRIRKSALLLLAPLILAIIGKITIIVDKDKKDLSRLNYELEKKIEETYGNHEPESLSNLLKTGDEVYLIEGLEFYASSDHEYGGNSSKGVIGSSIRPEGQYTAEYFSFLHNGNIIAADYKPDINLAESLEKVSTNFNIPIDEIEVQVHFGGPVCGWISLDDLVNNFEYEDVRMHVEEKTYSGVVDNFEGTSIRVDTEEGPVDIIIYDEEGNLLANDSIVMGSNGKEYKIINLSMENVNATTDTTKKQFKFSFRDIELDKAIITSVAAAVSLLLLKKKKKITTEMTEEQLLELINETRQKFSDDSEFDKAVRAIIGEKASGKVPSTDALREALIAQQITIEDVNNMGGGIKK